MIDPKSIARRYATKSDGQREDDEAERLVRKAPKVKPPRRDRRRERVEVDQDKDTDGSDKDLSMNYKTIGGSTKPSSVYELISVRLKKDPKKVVQVTRETLQKQPGKYLELKQEDPTQDSGAGSAPEAAPTPKAAPKKPKPPKEKPAPESSESSPSADSTKDLDGIRSTLDEMAKTDAEFASIIKDFGKPGSDIYEWAKARPETPIEQFLRGRTPPKGVETMGDLQQAMLHKPSKGQKAPAEGVPAKPKGKKTPKKTKQPGPDPGQETRPSAPKADGYPQRRASKAEWDDARDLITNTFPADIAADILLTRPKIHPDEVKSLVGDYKVARALEVKGPEIEKLRERAAKFYTTDPQEVQPPTKVVKGGKELLYGELSEEDQAKALRQHQIQTLAFSMAARDALSRGLEKEGAPEELATKLASFMLDGKGEAPEMRQKRASDEAESLFYEGLEKADKTTTNPEKVRKVLANLSDPAAKQLAVGFFQAQDYNQARKNFLDPTAEGSFTERNSPKIIASRLGKAMNFLWKQAEKYPEGMANDIAATFRSRVMRHLGALAPDKHPQVAERLDEVENKHYDRALKKYEKAQKAYEKAVAASEREYEKDYKTYSERAKAGEDPDPPLSSTDRLASQGILTPQEPIRPANYETLRKSPEELASSASDMWDRFNTRMARNLAKRASTHSFSSYLKAESMGNNNRQAVYWGVDPEPVKPYPEWSQPQACDLGEADFSLLVSAARKWLKSPVLSENIEGIQSDVQLRAALDLAIEENGYDSALQPEVYEMLLARLGGKSASSNTVRKEMSEIKIAKETANKILARLDHIAGVIQEKQEELGVPFKFAKDLVNSLDRIADDLEGAAFGDRSMLARQEKIVKAALNKGAKVVEREADEPYMDTFANPMSPVQTEADEPYMQAYSDDQSSAVISGKADNGRPLT